MFGEIGVDPQMDAALKRETGEATEPQRHRDTETQRHRDTETQRHRGEAGTPATRDLGSPQPRKGSFCEAPRHTSTPLCLCVSVAPPLLPICGICEICGSTASGNS